MGRAIKKPDPAPIPPKPKYFVPRAREAAQVAVTATYYNRAARALSQPEQATERDGRDGRMWYGDEWDTMPEPYRQLRWLWDCPSCGVAPRTMHSWECPRRTPILFALVLWIAGPPGMERQCMFGPNHPWTRDTYYRVGGAIARQACRGNTVSLFRQYRDIYGWELGRSTIGRAANNFEDWTDDGEIPF